MMQPMKSRVPLQPAIYGTARIGADVQATVGPRFEDFADQVFRRYEHVWKPRTYTVNCSYLRNQILPWFGDVPLADINSADVQLWFAGLHETPAAADRSLPILSVIFRHAEMHGLRSEGSNPCVGVRRYRRPGRERHLSLEEIRRLGMALAEQEAAGVRAASAVRLLVLTGCRQSEIRTLQWRDYRARHLFLPDSKAGPRTIWLSDAARAVLDCLTRTDRWVFPSSTGTGAMPTDTLYACWRKVRSSTGLEDIRLHDLRHSYASFALRGGESVPTIGRLLGHRDPATTLRYIHFADAALREAGEAIGEVLGADL